MVDKLDYIAGPGNSELVHKKISLAKLRAIVDSAYESVEEATDDEDEQVTIAEFLSSINANAPHQMEQNNV